MPINRNFKKLSRNLRRHNTEAESFVWQQLRNKKIGYKFFRQYVINDKYIVDFVCRERKIIIECDGGQHCDSVKDMERDTYLQKEGYTILRFWNNDILSNWQGCLHRIKQYLEIEDVG